MTQHILPPALPAQLEQAERGEELVDMARATEEPLADWRFSGLDLAGGSLRDMRFERCEFSGCRFTGADLSRATFLDVVFKNCDFSALRAQSAYFCRCRWQGVKAMGAILTDCRLVHTVLEACTLVGANLTGASIEQARFEGSDFTECYFSECRHKALTVAEDIFVQTSFFGTPLAGLDFTTSRFEGVTVSDSGAELRGAVVTTEQAADLARVLGVIVR